MGFLRYLKTPYGIVVSIISSIMLGVLFCTPSQPATNEEQEKYQVENLYWQNGLLLQPLVREARTHTLTISEANLLQQQRIAYYAQWSFVLVAFSVAFAAAAIVNQQHQTHLALEAAQKADRPWINFEFELVGSWMQMPNQQIPEVLSEFRIGIENHGKQPALRLRFDIVSVLGRAGLSEVMGQSIVRNASSEYGGQNIIMPESKSGTFGKIQFGDPRHANGEDVFVVVACEYFGPRAQNKPLKTVKAYHLFINDAEQLLIGSEVHLQRIE